MIPHCYGFHKVGLDMMMIKYCLCGSITYFPSVYFARRMGSLRVFHGGYLRTHLILLSSPDPDGQGTSESTLIYVPLDDG